MKNRPSYDPAWLVGDYGDTLIRTKGEAIDKCGSTRREQVGGEHDCLNQNYQNYQNLQNLENSGVIPFRESRPPHGG
ncbi:MAG: hypothetical protein HBSIN02_08150 [Bacteroidia bacterium]|nr:MAG: hypothetical protein HBSIN02_08150 [Bacteroidia bacterium]